MDVFFFITAIESVILTVLIAIVLYYFIKAGRSLSRITDMLEDGVKDSAEFVSELKDRLENNFLFRLFFPLRRKKFKDKR